MINREVIYDRNLTGSYMKIPICAGFEFDEKIMLRKKISGLLPVERCFLDGIGQYWYNISGKQSLDTFCRMQSIGIEFIEKMIISICSQIEILEWNLLEQNFLILDPEQIFISNQNQEIIFAIYPGYSGTISNGFQQLMEYLLTRIDHKDLDAVHIGYSIYEKTLEEAYNIVDIRNDILSKRTRNAAQNVIQNEEEEKKSRILGEMQEPFIDKKATNSKITNSKAANSKVQGKPDKKGRYEYNQLSVYFEEMIEVFQEWKERICMFKLPGMHEKRMEKKQEKKQSDRQIDIVYPEDEYREETVTIHPTICLGEYRTHPKGILMYQGTEQFKDIRLEETSSRVGKGPDCEVHIERDTISKYHARIEQQDQEFYLEDLNSTNGTYLNEELLSYKEVRQLKMNDIIRFADVQYRFL